MKILQRSVFLRVRKNMLQYQTPFLLYKRHKVMLIDFQAALIVMKIPDCHLYICFHLLFPKVFLKATTKAGETLPWDTQPKKEVPCISAPLKNSVPHCQAGALDAVRLKKLNRCSRLASFPGRVKYRIGYQFADPVNGATSQFLQRLTELAALECTTIHEEKTKRIRKNKKQET
uniref:Uncharacterized protein n=1 Tax=Micrurus surinamensis TaxID=129470 RepID=A0A2D4PY60_MICSU